MIIALISWNTDERKCTDVVLLDDESLLDLKAFNHLGNIYDFAMRYSAAFASQEEYCQNPHNAEIVEVFKIDDNREQVDLSL